MKILWELLHNVLAGPVCVCVCVCGGGGFYCCYFKFREECNTITAQLIRKSSSTVLPLGNIKKQYLNKCVILRNLITNIKTKTRERRISDRKQDYRTTSSELRINESNVNRCVNSRVAQYEYVMYFTL